MKKIRDRNMAYDDYVINANRVWSARLYYKANGQWVAVSNDYVQSMTINDYVCDGSNLTMGCFAGSKATLQLKNVSASVSAALVENVRVKVELSLTTDAIGNVGAAVLQSPVWVIAENKRKKRQGNTYDCSLTVYDISYTMTRSYTQTADAMTASQVVTAVGQRYGLTVDSSVTSAVTAMDGNTPHTFGIIDSDITDKQMLAYVAGYYGCYAEINESEQICFSWFKTSDEVIGPDRIYDGGVYVTEMTERTIVMLESGTSDNPIVAPDNASGFSINYENPYMDAERATAIYNAKIADGKISFRIGKVHYKGNPVNNPGTIVTVKDIDDDAATFYIMKRTLNYDGGLSETIECVGESEQTINYKVTSPMERKINRKFSRMEDAIKNATDVITQTKGSIYELIPVDENDPSKGNSGWKLHSTDESKQNVILANSSGIGFSSNGGQSFNAAAIYIDQNGKGHINADFIDTGKISASVVDTKNLIISSGNVEGLESELAVINGNVSTANNNASAASITANNAKSTADTAKSTADTANSTVSLWKYPDTTFINGGQIYTGSIITSKLSVGSAVVENLFYNSEFNEKPLAATTSVANWVYGWSPYASSLSFDTSTNIVTSSFYGNLIPHDRSEFVSTEGWSAENGTFTKPLVGLDFIKFDPKNGSSRSSIAHTVYLVNGKCYSLSCQVNFLGWGYVEGPDANDKKGTRIGYIIDGKMTYWNLFDSDGAPPENSGNEEYNLEFCFKFDGETGWHDVGLGWRDIWVDSTKTTPCSVHIAWIGISEVTTQRTKGIWSSNSKWTSKTTSYYGSVDSYVSNVLSPYLMKDLQIFFQKRRADVGKRYAILARIKIKNPETKSGLVGVWDGMEGKSYTQGSMSISSSSNMESFVTVKFVFDHDTSVADNIADYGIYWRGFYNSAGAPCDVLIRWMKMYEAPNEELGFYCSESTWLSSSFQSTRLLPDSDVSSTYMQAPSLFVKNNNLYFNGYVNGASGKMGCLGYSFNDVSITNSSYFYLNIAEPSSTRQFDISSRLSFNIPEKILTLGDANGNGANITEAYSPLYEAQTGISQTIEWNDGARTLKTVTSAGGVYISDATSEISITASGIWRKGTLYKWDNILK